MSRKTISRRDALGVIGKTGATLGAGACFFLSLRTSPLAAAWRDPSSAGTAKAQSGRVKAGTRGPEKVVISGSGSRLRVKVSGPPGRHFALACAATDAPEHYKAVANARGYIGENGLGTLEVDVKGLPNGKVYLRVVTGNTNAFDDDIAGTEAFVIKVSKGAIAGYEGLLSRPAVGARGAEITAASFAAACVSTKKR